jgi:ATP-dependent Lon protease
LKDLRSVGCISDISNLLKINDESVRIGVEGKKRAVISEIVSNDPFYMAKVAYIDYDGAQVTEDDTALYKVLLDKYDEFLEIINHTDDKFLDELEAAHPEKGIDMIAANIPISANEFYTLMTCLDTNKRLNLAIEYIMMIIKVARIELDIESKLAESFTEEQKQRYLREKKYIINKELSEEDEDEEIAECRTAIEKLPIGNEYKDRLLKELSRLEMTPPDSREASTIMSYFDCILDLPWSKKHGRKFDIGKAMKKLEADHYGMKDVKERIIEYLAVLSLTNKIKGPILCLVGPPGVGKTSVAKSVAEATNRKFVRVSLGGMDDEAVTKGQRKTYVGAMPVRIIGGLRQVQSKNPVFLLDEIDKLSKSYSGDPASALLEVLDPEQNSKFTDTYVEVPFDLSDVLFITTANTLSTVPKPLADRMEVIELSGYTPDEKLEIAKHYLVDKQLKLNGITRDNLDLSDEVIYEIISCYTCESGVRELERCIASLCRKAAKALVVSKESFIIGDERKPARLPRQKSATLRTFRRNLPEGNGQRPCMDVERRRYASDRSGYIQRKRETRTDRASG